MNNQSTPTLSLADVETARRRLATGLRVTPCQISAPLSELAGMRIWLKRDDLHRTGSFKERGARNALLCLSEEQRRRGVVAASAGNHALGLAFHGAQLGAAVSVVVPTSAPAVKINRCRALGANVVVRGTTFDDSQHYAAELAEATGATVLHPFDDVRVMAGQGTLGLELLEQAPDVDTIVVPVGGGGLLGGLATAVKALRPEVRIVAVEPAHAAGFLAAQLCGRPTHAAVAPTLADGLAVSCVGGLTFSVAGPLVDDVVTVSEEEIAVAIAVLARQAGAISEGAGAAGLAAVLAGKISARCVGVPLTGRNIDARLHERLLADHATPAPRSRYADAA